MKTSCYSQKIHHYQRQHDCESLYAECSWDYVIKRSVHIYFKLWRLKTSCACQSISSSKEKASTTLTWLSQYTVSTGHPRETIALLWRRMSRASAAQRARTRSRAAAVTRAFLQLNLTQAEESWLQIHEYYSRPEVLSRFCQTRKKIPVAPPPCVTSTLKPTVVLARFESIDRVKPYQNWTLASGQSHAVLIEDLLILFTKLLQVCLVPLPPLQIKCVAEVDHFKN